MEFSFVLNASPEYQGFDEFLIELERSLASSFNVASYGASVRKIVMPIVIVSQEFASFYETMTPRYYGGKNVVEEEGISFTIEDVLEIPVKLDGEQLMPYPLAGLCTQIRVSSFDLELALSDLGIPEFDVRGFLSDLRGRLEIIESSAMH